MEIILVQPTDKSYRLNKALNSDFWELVNDSDEYGSYITFKRLDAFFCDYDIFRSFAEAEKFLDDIDMGDTYKKRMRKELDKIKDDVRIFNWAVA